MTRTLWTCTEILQATGGVPLSPSATPFSVTGITLDSRTAAPGDLFVAVAGPKVDGHQFIANAFENGASGALVSHESKDLVQQVAQETGHNQFILVPDVLKALEALAAVARARSQAKIVAITGSFGKTSMKSVLHHILAKQGATLATDKSENNHWGVPLTLARLHPDDRYAVIEMGMNNPGEIHAYSMLVRPHIALITITGDAHIGKLGSLEKIAAAKAEIFDGLEPGCIAVLNRQDPFYPHYKECLEAAEKTWLTFGQHKPATFSYEFKHTQAGAEVRLHYLNESQVGYIQTWSDAWLANIPAAAAVLLALNIDWKKACLETQDYHMGEGRGAVIPVRTSKGCDIVVLDESYNAAPQSMALAIKTLQAMRKEAGRTIAILGDMLELGDRAEAYHQGLRDAKHFDQINKVYGCGPLMKTLYDALPKHQQGGWAEDPQALMATVLGDIQPNDVYLVKGSRGQWARRGRMAAFVDALVNLE